MILRSCPLPWILVITFLLIVFYFKLQLNDLEKTNKILEDAVLQLQSQVKSDSPVNYERQASSLEDTVIIYNRVPKTGSTTFVGVVYDLCKPNKYHTLHINVSSNMHTLTLPNQVQFVKNITQWDSIKPAFYHGHMAFLNFDKFGVKQAPLYINLLRKPLDRFVSYYYFLRYGDNFRPHLVRKKHGDTTTFDECITSGQADCDPNNMWLQIPFLCGHDPGCWEIGNKWALEEAKRNIERHYFLVGVTEELMDFVKILQAVLPRFFRGAYEHLSHNNKSHLRQTVQKISPLPETVDKIRKSIVWQMENELYNYALAHFHAVKKRVINASPQHANQRFFYEKIRPQ